MRLIWLCTGWMCWRGGKGEEEGWRGRGRAHSVCESGGDGSGREGGRCPCVIRDMVTVLMGNKGG